jgi:aldehyde:ferredoxin oxidoreductase
MSGVTKVKNHHCPQEGCDKLYHHEKDMMKHDAKHQVYEGHRNAFSCEICCFQFERMDNLNRHRSKIHHLPALAEPYEAVEFAGSFKLIASFEGMLETNHSNVRPHHRLFCGLQR